jgi:hypothetical protein
LVLLQARRTEVALPCPSFAELNAVYGLHMQEARSKKKKNI